MALLYFVLPYSTHIFFHFLVIMILVISFIIVIIFIIITVIIIIIIITKKNTLQNKIHFIVESTWWSNSTYMYIDYSSWPALKR